MKKIISILTALALLFTALSICASARERSADTVFAVASDLHFSFPDEQFEITNDDTVFGYANRRASLSNESGYIIDVFLKQCAESEC